ncbi:MAG: hypothetical protein ACTHK0_05705 [Ginsengibacter sp.]
MTEISNSEVFISKSKPATSGQDYSFLREAGIGYVQSLSSDIWTDYNIHDPGITILEVLAYAITDLSARANKPVNDLLASKPNSLDAEKDFFSAAEILPCSPVTANDFRKLLIDHPDIQNAWLTKSTESEQNFYFDKNNGLNYNAGEIITVNGLYNVLLEFELDELNSSVLSVTIAGGVIEAAYPFWDEISTAWANDLVITNISTIQLNLISIDAVKKTYFAVLKIAYTGGSDQFGITVTADSSIAQSDIKNKLEETGSGSLIKQYNERIVAANIILNGIKFYLNSNRNISEDFYAFKATRIQEIAITAQIEIAQGVDLISTLAQIYYRLDKFLSPKIQFYTLDEMLLKPGITVDEIFEGPLLQNGFIDDQELVELNRNNIIYTSDLLGVIMSLNNDFNYGNLALTSQNKGIISVQNLTVTNYINNQVIADNVRDCLSLMLTDIYKPRLSVDKSLIRITKNSVQIDYSLSDVITAFNNLKAQNAIIKSPQVSDIQIPKGNNLFVDDYYSIQNDFPITYGIGKAGLPSSSSNERKGQANQLKGFLLFFEQLLADYLSQLAHVKDLFSINSGIDNTYFWQSLKNMSGNDSILESTYETTVPSLLAQSEQEQNGIDRRNKFLDHLLARFGEDFTEYALLMYSNNKDTASGILINDKSDFLKSYADLSYNRSKSFNYLSTDNWNTDNVPWLKRRICSLLGIEAYQDQDLAGNEIEGFHLIENILLRPKVNDSGSGKKDKFLNVSAGDESKKDPYSFRLIFIFPGWHSTGRFTDPEFTKFIEKIIQRETPAHILAEIYWLTDTGVMSNLESALKSWLTASATVTDPLALSDIRNKLIDAINVFFK